VIIADLNTSIYPYTIHILRLIDIYKRLEMLLRDFMVSETNLSEEQVIALISSPKSVVQDAFLTNREIEVLSLAAKGASSKAIAGQLFISPTTVDNHLRHILKKLNAHSRLEAVRRAERSGII
jgi:DNA-binding NarL/FixJ family response regulator